MTNLIEEIRTIVDHNDNQLAKRRILDVAFETNNADIIRKAIIWSKSVENNLLKQESLEPILNALEHANFAQKPTLNLLEAKSIVKQYKKGSFSIKPFDIKVESGQIIGIVGENGNGKTTILRSLAGHLQIDEGFIQYFGESKLDYYHLKNKIAFIPQRIPRWFGNLKDNLHFSAAISGIKGDENSLMVDYILERMNLTKYANLTWDRISSGYRTRFEIARILIQKPNLLILDEPLANLDIHAQQTLLSDLKFLVQSPTLQLGVILSSQQLHEVEKVADKVVFIKDGISTWNSNKNVDRQSDESKINILEIETTTDRQLLNNYLGVDVQIQFNGNFYTLKTNTSINEVLQKLLANGVELTYFRDITHSTKRFFAN